MIDYDVGDVVVCVRAGASISKGEIGRVAGFRHGPTLDSDGFISHLGVYIEGRKSTGSKGSYNANRFRKLPKAEDDFTAFMRQMKPTKVDA